MAIAQGHRQGMRNGIAMNRALAGQAALVRVPFHADTVTWLAAVTANGGTVTGAQTSAVDWAVRAINARGLRTNLKRFNPMVGDALAMAVPVYKDWGGALDVVTGSPTVNASGLDSANSTTKWLETNVTPSTATGWDSTNNHLGIWMSDGNITGGDKGIAGVWSNSGTLRWGFRWNASGNIIVYFGTTGEQLAPNSHTLGMLSGHQLLFATAGVTNFWQDGVSAATPGTNPTNGKPTGTIRIGNINSGALNGSGIYGGYHMGMSLTSQNAVDWADIMNGFAQKAGRMQGWVNVGDSLTSAGTWPTLLQSGTYPRTVQSSIATGGISTPTMLTNLQTALTNTPCLKWRNCFIWGGQNDPALGNWDGTLTEGNVATMLALFPHNGFRVIGMIPKNTPTEYTGQTLRLLKDGVNTYWTSRYGAKFCNVATPLIAGGTGTGQDAVDLANGCIPSSLKKTLSAYNISAITKAVNAAVTTAAQPFIIGDVVTFASIGGMVELNSVTAQAVTVADTTHFTINKDSTGYTTYTSGGTATQVDPIHINASGDAIVASTLATSLAGGW